MFWEDSENFPTSIAKILDSRKNRRGEGERVAKLPPDPVNVS
jgi:hypothetical protein